MAERVPREYRRHFIVCSSARQQLCQKVGQGFGEPAGRLIQKSVLCSLERDFSSQLYSANDKESSGLLIWAQLVCPGGSDSKESACSAGRPALIPGWGRSPGEGNGNHSSILAWKIPWKKERGGLQFTKQQRVG